MVAEISRRSLLRATAAGAVVTAGCTSSSGTPTGADSPTEPATDSPTATADGSSPTVRVRSHAELGKILVGAGGMTLYMFDSDTQGAGSSTCYDGCAANWPPLTVDGEPTAGEAVTAELATFSRKDGATQVAANGWPLYYFTSDEQPGDARGQGVGDVWWVLRPDGTPVRSTATPTATGTATPAGSPTPTPTDSYY